MGPCLNVLSADGYLVVQSGYSGCRLEGLRILKDWRAGKKDNLVKRDVHIMKRRTFSAFYIVCRHEPDILTLHIVFLDSDIRKPSLSAGDESKNSYKN